MPRPETVYVWLSKANGGIAPLVGLAGMHETVQEVRETMDDDEEAWEARE